MTQVGLGAQQGRLAVAKLGDGPIVGGQLAAQPFDLGGRLDPLDLGLLVIPAEPRQLLGQVLGPVIQPLALFRERA